MLHGRHWVRLVCMLLVIVVGASSADAQKKKKKKLPSQKFKGYGLPEAVKTRPQNLPKVSKVDENRRTECRDVAARIDALVEAKLKQEGLAANPEADDYTFVRRAYLNITGTIPSLQQTSNFVKQGSARKHEELVDRLLNSYGYVSHTYNYWASILRIKDRPENNILAYPYRDWVKDQIRINRPYDDWVSEMLTAEGKVWESPASGYLLRDRSMPLVHVDNTVRVFLGTQIGCAQCHDHPFDRWTQKEFYQLAAFTHGAVTRDGRGQPAYKNGNPVERLKQEKKDQTGENRIAGTANLLLQANLFRVSFNPKRVLKLPHDYQYSDGKPNQRVESKVLWGEIPAEAASLSKREKFAAWVTNPSNDRFAKTIANRLWKRVFGVGLIEPVDDLKDDSPCQNEELLELLCEEMKRLDFDLKEFTRTLMYTATYRRQCSDFDPSMAEFYHFPGPRLRRMSAEQIWDSILTLAVYNPMSVEAPSTDELARVANLDLAEVSYSQLTSAQKAFDESLSPQARNKAMNQTANYRRQVLMRASELPSPLPPDHFLRQFGQGDRETIQGDSVEPTVPQILTMFNGPFSHMLLEKGSVIYDNLMRARTKHEALDVMFLTILNRPPTSRDKTSALREMGRGDAAMGYGNVVWALINTREFMFIQ
ncbi:MAG TPA: hypothetical protein DDW52_12010 [Planctomycetaceae bacterium]|nr:hypothetical protein [Planctomycetaceae bacterium]